MVSPKEGKGERAGRGESQVGFDTKLSSATGLKETVHYTCLTASDAQTIDRIINNSANRRAEAQLRACNSWCNLTWTGGQWPVGWFRGIGGREVHCSQ